MPNLRLPAVALAAALLAAACGGSVPSSGATTSPGSGGPATSLPAPSSDAPTGATATDGPSATDAPATDEPTPSGDASTSPEPEATESATASTGGAEACSGSDDNRRFFVRIAKAIDWPVLCGVLPRGWFVDDGKYRLANGGWLRIGYKGPGGASLWLHEGASCVTNGGCDPSGSDLGGAALGPFDGTLYDTGDGYAILAAPGENPSWYLTTSGLDQATTEELAAKLAQVGG